MTDDIVDELRRFAELADRGSVQLVITDGDVFEDAADEIDKLRHIIRALRRELEATRVPNPHRSIERAVPNITVKLDPTASVRPTTRWRDL